MSTTTSFDADTLADLVQQLATQVFDPRIFEVYSNTRRALQRPVKGRYPHLVGVGKVSQRVELVGMVETTESLHDLDAAARRWHALEPLQAAMYLYVPKGHCADARTLCLRERILVSDFRHYWFEAGTLHVERCFA